MSVSKQDWKDFGSNTWPGCKPTYDKLMQAFEALISAIEGGDADTFLSHTEDDGLLRAAVSAAGNVASAASSKISGLALQGNQRRFANKHAIAISEAAIASLAQYSFSTQLLDTELVRGVRLEHDQVQQDRSKMAQIGDFGRDPLLSRLRRKQFEVKSCYEDAQAKVASMAAIDKIGVV